MKHKYLVEFFWKYSVPVLLAGSVNLWMVTWQWDNAVEHPKLRALYVILATLNAAMFVYTCMGAARSMWRGHKVDRWVDSVERLPPRPRRPP